MTTRLPPPPAPANGPRAALRRLPRLSTRLHGASPHAHGERLRGGYGAGGDGGLPGEGVVDMVLHGDAVVRVGAEHHLQRRTRQQGSSAPAPDAVQVEAPQEPLMVQTTTRTHPRNHIPATTTATAT
eukprot:4202935-Pyramimonas_sp.AAC.1